MTVSQMRVALEAHRLERNLSYEQLAAAIGPDRVTSQTLRRFVDGRITEPRKDTLYAIRTYMERIERERDEASRVA